jgi:uncharacterized peroxidase-related enzyme
MPRLPTPSNDDVPADSRPALQVLEKRFGHVSNFLRVLANSPLALEGYLGLSDSLDHGTLPRLTRERIALAISEFNGCDYSLSEHTYLARKISRLDDAEITANRNGASNDPKAEAAVRFAVAVARERGHISQQQFDDLTAAGYDDAQVIEIVYHVALTTFSNDLNKVANTEIDFPVVQTRPSASVTARSAR